MIALLTELPDYSVLCSHGDILPDTIAGARASPHGGAGSPDWRKGVVWEIDRVNGVFLRARALAPER